jgi:hypothetical protein
MVKQLLSWVILIQIIPYMCLWLDYLGLLKLFFPPKSDKNLRFYFKNNETHMYI